MEDDKLVITADEVAELRKFDELKDNPQIQALNRVIEEEVYANNYGLVIAPNRTGDEHGDPYFLAVRDRERLKEPETPNALRPSEIARHQPELDAMIKTIIGAKMEMHFSTHNAPSQGMLINTEGQPLARLEVKTYEFSDMLMKFSQHISPVATPALS